MRHLFGLHGVHSNNGQYIPIAQDQALELTFDDIANVPVGDASSVSEWNTFFDLPTNGTVFSSVIVAGNVVKLYGGSGIKIIDYRFQLNTNIISIDDKAGCVTEIGYKSFDHSTSATSFKFNSCVTVGDDAFYDCASASIELNNLTTAGLNSFHGMSSATSFNFPKLSAIPGQCFMNCSSSTGFSFPLATIAGSQSFKGCSGASSFSLPICTNIGNFSFDGCNHNASYDLSSVTAMGASVLNNSVFANISGKIISITVPAALMTCNGGSPDGDIATLVVNNYVTVITV